LTDSASNDFCIATLVTDKAIKAMLDGSGSGIYKDDQPWLIARDLLESAHDAKRQMPILFAVTKPAEPAYFSHWSTIKEIEVITLHKGLWATRCHFNPLQSVNPIFEFIDSIYIKPSAEQLARELKEGLRKSRQSLQENQLYPYAICETPAFIAEALSV
jgi:hypothetical protein